MRTKEEIKAEYTKVLEERLQIEFKIDRLLNEEEINSKWKNENTVNRLLQEEENCNNRLNELMQEIINLFDSEKEMI